MCAGWRTFSEEKTEGRVQVDSNCAVDTRNTFGTCIVEKGWVGQSGPVVMATYAKTIPEISACVNNVIYVTAYRNTGDRRLRQPQSYANHGSALFTLVHRLPLSLRNSCLIPPDHQHFQTGLPFLPIRICEIWDKCHPLMMTYVT